jgi:hypothetical protein
MDNIQGISEKKTRVTALVLLYISMLRISNRKQEQKETWMGLAFCNAARHASVEFANFISPEHTASKTAKRADAVSIHF